MLCPPVLILAVLIWFGLNGSALWQRPVQARPSEAVGSSGQFLERRITFSRDIAPILYSNCASCHHAGQPAPFNLLTYRDVWKHARQIVEVTQSGYMPPWLPEHGYGDFLNERRLDAREKELIRQWVEQGAPEGNPEEAPPQPEWPDGWMLGKPDLVVTMDRPYTLGAEGPDVYRNFVLPVPIDRDRFVRAVEFAPGNARIVHHAFVKLDQHGGARRLDGMDGAPGFGGMEVPAEMPDGQFLTWQPGKVPAPGPEGMPWRLPKSGDLVLQTHLNRTGKPELLQASIGLYFTDQPPTNSCFKLALLSLALDLPAGVSNTVVRDSLVLPVDTEVLAILPHAHYLAREMQGYALLPDGTKRWLLWIRQWDFRWQGEYRYARPVHLPKGTSLHLEFTYDNSTNNIRNPNSPPKRVFYGPQSSDEMCELWFQLLPAQRSNLQWLQQASESHMHRVFVGRARHQIEVDPANAKAHADLGSLLWGENKRAEGWQQIQRAIELNPESAQAHLAKGIILRATNRAVEARQELETALRLDHSNARTYGHLGFVYATLGHATEAERCFRKALELDPGDSVIKDALEELRNWEQSHRVPGTDQRQDRP